MENYLDVGQDAGRRFYLDFNEKGKVVMLNLLKHKSVADYEGAEAIKPEGKISGESAYKLYMDLTLPELDKAGSTVLFFGESKHFLIGPDNEKWDAVLLVEHESAAKFIAFAQNKDYLKNEGHRTAALEDSRLLPITKKGI